MQQNMQQLQEGAPKETLYIKNLNEKISPEDLKYALYFLFSQYGEILEIQCKKNNALRGQAFLTFREITAATNAKTMLNNFSFFSKNLVIQFAKQKNDKIAAIEGHITGNQRKRRKLNKQQEKQAQNNQQENKDQPQLEQQKTQQQQQEQNQENYVTQNPVNSILHLENLPPFTTQDMLKALFGQYPGYVESRLIVQRQMAFVEYQSEDQAQVAVQGLQGFRIEEYKIKIEYAKNN